MAFTQTERAPDRAPGAPVARRFASILDTIGRTPVIRINRLGPPGVNLYVKAEAFNPMGSVKDRMARSTIEAAEQQGELVPGQTVVEATSGNTGIGLAMVCAAKGYPLVITMAENFSVERRRILRFLGAKVVLTPAAQKGTGMVEKARELAQTHGWFWVRQFENEANADVHSRTTAEEILEAFSDTELHWFVTGYGTGGTLKGTGRVFRERSPITRIVVCEPDNSALIGSGVPQARNDDGTAKESHPAFRPHLMQGWTPDFIPKLTGDAMALGLIDRLLPINGNDALRCSGELARHEGIFTGISGGATFAGALEVAHSAETGSNVLCMLPDTGERYLSTPLFADVPADMNEEEEAIARSTPNYRFDRPATPAPSSAAPAPASDPEGERLLDAILADGEQPVVVFSLEWCEFAWAVRRLLDAIGVHYRRVALDSAEHQRDGTGAKIRAALTARTGIPTIPQIFIGGELVGDCQRVFDEYRSGRLTERLAARGITPAPLGDRDPASFLPNWLHSR